MSEHPTLDKIRDETEEIVSRLKKERDELALQSHLFKAELKDEWEEIESKWRFMEQRFERMRNDAAESVHEIGGAVKQVSEEISVAYSRMRNRSG